MICEYCLHFGSGEYTAILAGHDVNCPVVSGLRDLVDRVRDAVHRRSLVGAFTTYSNGTIGLRGTFTADDLRDLADALEPRRRRDPRNRNTPVI